MGIFCLSGSILRFVRLLLPSYFILERRGEGVAIARASLLIYLLGVEILDSI